MYDLLVWEKISFIRSCDTEEIKATDFIIKVHITSGNIKWRSFALRFHASNHKSTWQPLLPSAKGLSFTFISYPYARFTVIFTFPFYILSFGKHIVLERSWYICIYIYIYPIGCDLSWTIIVDITLKMNTLGGEIISPYLSQCPTKTPQP